MRFVKNRKLLFFFMTIFALFAQACSAVAAPLPPEDFIKLIERAADPEVRKAIREGFNANEVYTVDFEEVTPLIVAIKFLRPEIFRILIGAGVDLELKTNADITPLATSIMRATAVYVNNPRKESPTSTEIKRIFSMEIFDLLLAHGADVNRPSSFSSASTTTTPLGVAAGGSDFKSVLSVTTKLLAAGAKVNPVGGDKYVTPPLFNALGGAMSIKDEHRGALIKLLLDAGADPNAALPDGTRPLHIASGMDSSYVNLLLAAGADKRAKDANGRTPFGVALRSFNFRVLFILAFH